MTPEQEHAHWSLLGLPVMPEYRAFIEAWRACQEMSERESISDKEMRLAHQRQSECGIRLDEAVAREYPGADWNWNSLAKGDMVIHIYVADGPQRIATYSMEDEA